MEEISAEQAARNRHAAAVRALEIDVYKGVKYREAVEALERDERNGAGPATLAMRRFAVALYAPLPKRG